MANRNVQRINGNPEQLHNWSEQELETALVHADLRIEAATQDRTLLLSELALRNVVDLGDV